MAERVRVRVASAEVVKILDAGMPTASPRSPVWRATREATTHHPMATSDPIGGHGHDVDGRLVGNDEWRSRTVGDSRAYRFRDGELESSPTTHSLVGGSMRAGS